MDDPLNIPGEELPEKSGEPDAAGGPELHADLNPNLGPAAQQIVADVPSVWTVHQSPVPSGGESSRRHILRHNLLLLLCLTLAAFTLTAWILVRVDSPFGFFSTGPQEVVRAQLQALDQGELRPAYDMFSANYRQQVTFADWRELVMTHWRMFHTEVLRSGTPAQSGARVTLEIYLHGADDKNYRARFILIHTSGRWWIDDVHWTEEADERDFSRT